MRRAELRLRAMKTNSLLPLREALTTGAVVALLVILSVPAGAAEAQPVEAAPQYQGWQHSGSIYILTTPEGANLPASTSEEGFPLLVRLHKDFFDFSQAKANGEDLRWSTTGGTPLAYEIEEWDAA